MLPAIIIGIGGTGKWVITDIKKTFLKKGIPQDNVKLLCFDLIDANEVVPVKRLFFNINTGNIEDLMIDYGAGKTPEFYNFGGYWANTIFEIKKGKHKEYASIYEWINEDAESYILSETELHTRGGGGQKRQPTRVSLFLNANEIYERIKDAISEVSRGVSTESPILIFIISSLAGGTGCGTFIDFALMVHTATVKIGRPITSITPIGIFLLPQGFEGIRLDEQMRTLTACNCFAAFRELHRLTFIYDNKVEYQTGLKANFGDTRIFDVVYLIDGTTVAGESGSKVPHYSGTCPAMADFVLYYINENTSPQSTLRNLVTIIGSEIKKNEDSPMDAQIFSTFGIYECILDINEIKKSFGHKIEKNVLEYFITQKRAISIYEEIQKNFLKLSSFQGRKIVIREKKIIEIEQQHEFSNTPFNTKLVTSLLGESPFSFNDRNLIEAINLNAPDAVSLPLIDFSQIDTGSFFRRISFEKVKEEADGLKNDLLNILEQNLDKLKNKHEEKFKEYLQNYLLSEILDVEDRQGSLLHAFDFLDALSKIYEKVENILKEKKDELKLQEALEKSNDNLTSYIDGKKKKEYVAELENNTRIIQLSKLIQVSISIAQIYKLLCNNYKEKVKEWIETFKKGISKVEDSLSKLQKVRWDERNIKVHKYVTNPDDNTEDKLYRLIIGIDTPDPNNPIEVQINKRLPHINLNEICCKFNWGFENEELECFLSEEYKPMDVFKENWLIWNYNFINNLIEKGELKQLDNISIMDILALKKVDPKAFGEELNRNSSPFVAYDQTAQYAGEKGEGSVRVPSQWHHYHLVRPSDPPGRDFADQLKDFLNKNRIQEKPGYNDIHKIIIFKCENYIKPKGFVNLQTTEIDYRKGVTKNSPAPLHVLPGERNAAKYEEKFPEILLEEPRCFHPKVVRLLDSKEIGTFLYAYTFYEQGRLPFHVEVKDGKEQFYCKSGEGEKNKGEDKEFLGPVDDPIKTAHHFLFNPEPRTIKTRNTLKKAVDNFLNEKLKNRDEFLKEIQNAYEKIIIERDNKSANEDFKRLQKIFLALEKEKFSKTK